MADAEAAAQERPAHGKRGCHFFNAARKHYCGQEPLAGERFCTHHMRQTQSGDPAKERVPCPYDSKHSVYVGKLRKHLRICNARPAVLSAAFFVPDVNLGDDAPAAAAEIDPLAWIERMRAYLPSGPGASLPAAIKQDKAPALRDKVPVERLRSLGEQVLAAADREPLPPMMHLGHAAVDRLRVDGTVWSEYRTRQHQQLSSLVAHLERRGWLRTVQGRKKLFVEFGAGRGTLSDAVFTVDTDTTSRFVLVDRCPQHGSLDNKGDRNGRLERVKVDIKDFRLAAFKPALEPQTSVAAIGKHLCGAATDMTLRAVAQMDADARPATLLIALCCHHRCTHGTFVNREYLEGLGLGGSETFDLICRMSSWGPNLVDDAEHVAPDDADDAAACEALPTKWRHRVGLAAKFLLNEGRIRYLRDLGYRDAEIVRYAPPEITKENALLAAGQLGGAGESA